MKTFRAYSAGSICTLIFCMTSCAPMTPILPTAKDFEKKRLFSIDVAISEWPVPKLGSKDSAYIKSGRFTYPSIGPQYNLRVLQNEQVIIRVSSVGIQPIFAATASLKVDSTRVMNVWMGYQAYSLPRTGNNGLDSSAFTKAFGAELNWINKDYGILGAGVSVLMLQTDNASSVACTELCMFGGGISGGYSKRAIVPYFRWVWLENGDLKVGFSFPSNQPAYISTGWRF